MTETQVGLVDLVVGSAVVIVALVAVVAPKRASAVVSFLVLGTLLSVLWALVGAPDVAIAEAALGTGVTGVLFITTVTGRRRAGPADQDRPRVPSRIINAAAAIAAVAVLGGTLGAGLMGAAEPIGGAPAGLSGEVGEVLPDTGVSHPVTAVLLNLRSYDTLLEIAVLFVATLVVLTLARHRPTVVGGHPVPLLQDAATAVLAPTLVLLAAWLLVAGTRGPGGAFQAGAVLTAAVLMLHLSARAVLPLDRRRSPVLAALGLLAFVLVAAVGPMLGGAWLELRPAVAGVVILALEIFLAVSIGASLALIALALQGDRGGGR